MKKSDIEVGGVYRYTYSGVAASPLNKRGPWLVGVVVDHQRGGAIIVEPVPGLPIAVGTRPPTGASLATRGDDIASEAVHVTRFDGHLCDRSDWGRWRESYLNHEAAAEANRVDRTRREREATRGLVAALMALGHDVGEGQWDRSTPWGQFVDDVRRREVGLQEEVAAAFEALADDRVQLLNHAAASAWLES